MIIPSKRGNVKAVEKRAQADSVLQRVERLRWAHSRIRGTSVTFYGLSIRQSPHVFSPAFGEGTHLIAQALDIRPAMRVLDVGTGSGALALLAARRGASVVATDISPYAVVSARRNAFEAGLQDQVEVRWGDLYVDQVGDRPYDLVLFNAPFLEGEPRTWLDRALLDPDHSALKRFLADLTTHLTPVGYALLAFSSAGDADGIHVLADDLRLDLKEQCRQEGEFTFFLFRLTPRRVQQQPLPGGAQ